MSSELKSVSYEYGYVRELIDEKIRKIGTILNKVLNHELKKTKSTEEDIGEFEKILKP